MGADSWRRTGGMCMSARIHSPSVGGEDWGFDREVYSLHSTLREKVMMCLS